MVQNAHVSRLQTMAFCNASQSRVMVLASASRFKEWRYCNCTAFLKHNFISRERKWNNPPRSWCFQACVHNLIVYVVVVVAVMGWWQTCLERFCGDTGHVFVLGDLEHIRLAWPSFWRTPIWKQTTPCGVTKNLTKHITNFVQISAMIMMLIIDHGRKTSRWWWPWWWLW